MKRIAFSGLFIGLMLCLAGAPAASPQGGGVQITKLNYGKPESGIPIIVALKNKKNSGSATTPMTATTNANGDAGNVLDLSDMGKVNVDVYEQVCVDGKIQIVIVNSGVTPDPNGCKEQKKLGGGWIGPGGHITIEDSGDGSVTGLSKTATGMNTGTGMGTSNSFSRYQVTGLYNYYKESDANYNGGGGLFLVNVTPMFGIAGKVNVDHWSGDDASANQLWYMGGPRFTKSCARGDVYGQALFGGEYSSNTYTFVGTGGSGGTTTETSTSGYNGFGLELGGGADVNLTPRISIGVAPYYNGARFSGQYSNHFGLDVGLNLKF